MTQIEIKFKSLFAVILVGIVFVGLALKGVLPENSTAVAIVGGIISIIIAFIKTFYSSGQLLKGLTTLIWLVTIASFAAEVFTISTGFVHYSPQVVLYVTTSLQALIIYLGQVKLWQG